MKHKFFTLTLALLTMAFAVNAQKMTTADKVPLKKQIVQKKNVTVKKRLDNNHTSSITYQRVRSGSKGVILSEGFETWPPADWGFYELGDPAGWQSTTSAHSGSGAAYHADDNVATACQDWMVTPALTIDDPAYTLNFWEYQNYDSYYTLHRVVVLDGPDPSSATELGELYSAVGTEDTWVEQNFSLAAYDGQTVYIGFYYEGDWSDQWTIDDVEVSFPEPYMFAISAPTGADVIAGESYDYNVTIENTGTSNDTYDLTSSGGVWDYAFYNAAGDTEITDIAVDAGTSEDFIVRVTVNAAAATFISDTENIVVTSQGDNSVTDNFDITTTAIAADAVISDFNDGTVPPVGWSSTDGEWGVTSLTVYEGANAAYSWNPDTLITPKLDIEDGDQLKFFARNSSWSGGEMAIIISDDKENWTALTTTPATLSDAYEEFTVDFTSAEAGGKYIGFVDVSDYFYLDYVVFSSSLYPYSFSIDAPADEAALLGSTIDYTATINNTGLNVDVFTPSIDDNGAWTYELFEADGTTPASSFSINAEESADFIIRATVPATGVADGDTDTESITVTSAEGSKAVESFEITTTAVAPQTIPFTEDFAAGFPADRFTEAGGILADPTELSGSSSAWTEDGFANDGSTGSAKINIWGTTKDEWMFTPFIDLEDKDCYLEFDMALTSFAGTDLGTFGEDDIFALVISTDNGQTWTSANALIMADNTYDFSIDEHVKIDLSGYTGVIKLGFYGESTVSNEDNDLFIDNISITEIPANDLAISGLNFNSLGVIGTPHEIEVIVLNNGLDLQPAGATISITEDGTEVATATTTVDLAKGESETVTATYTPAAAGDFSIGANVPTDDDDTNNEMTAPITVINAGQLYEEFANAVPPTAWNLGANTGDWTWEAETDGWSDYITMDGQYASLVSNSTGTIDTLFTPQLTVDGTITDLSFDIVGAFQTTASGGVTLDVIYSTDGETWSVVHTVDLTADEAYRTETADLSGLANGDYYFGFAPTNTYTNAGFINLVGIDNVQGPVIVGLDNNDLTVETVTYPSDFVYSGDEITISANIKNVGLDLQTGTEVSLVIDGGAPMTTNIGALGYGQTEMVEFTWTATTGGSHTFEVSVAADDNTANDSYTMDAIVTEEGMLTEGFEDTFAPAGWIADSDWQKWTATWTPIHEGVAGAAAGNTAGFTDAILATPKIDLTGSKAYEELNFYACLGNPGVGAADLDIVYSDNGTTWTEIQGGIVPNETMDLYTIDLSAIPDGQYHLGFRASGSGDGTYATWIVIDHVVAPQMETYDINFTVEDTDGNPLDGATINVNETELTTVAGAATISGMYPGDYDYTVSKYWYDDAAGTATVANADVDETVTMSLTTTYSVTFNVHNDIAEPLEGATVTVNIDGTDTDLTTNAEGKAFVDLINGDYDYTASMNNHDGASGTINVNDADISEDITLVEHTYTVTFAVDDGSGEPAEGAIVSINGTDLMTDVDGIATIDLKNGTYDYGVEFGFCQTYSSTIVVDMADVDEFVTLDCPDVYSVTFLVDDGTDPLEGATVAVGGVEEMTDVTGTAVVHLPDGTYTYAIDYGFADTYTGAVTVDLAPEVVGPISLVVPDTYSVTFAVTDGTMPLQGVTIDFLTEDISLTTDENGEAFTMLPEDSFDYEASLALYETVAGTLNVPAGGTTEDIVMTLLPYNVTFNVTDETGANPIAGATVTIDGTDYTTDPSGVALVEDLAPATYDYTVVADTYDDVAGSVVVVDQDVTENVTMPLSTYALTFTVTDGTDPIEGATVTANGTDIVTNVDGEAIFADLLPATYDYTVIADGYEDYTGSVDVVDQDVSETVEMTIIPDYNVLFTVDNANGDLLEGAAVIIGADEVLTNSAGEATFVLTPGDYDYMVVLEGYEDATGTVSVVDADVTEAVTMVETIENPTGLAIAIDGYDATFTWDPDLAPLELSQHSGVPDDDGGYYQSFGNGYGVIYDLTPYTDAVVAEMDFHHVSWGVTGTWEYKIHVVDWDAQSIVYTTDMLTTTGDDQWEEGIDLNDIGGLGGKNVAILLEPFGNTADDAYPDVNTDGALDGASILGPLDDLSSMQSSSDAAGDFVMDLWIMTSGASEPVKAQRISLNNTPTAQPKAASVSGDNYVMTNQKAVKALVDYNVFLDGDEVDNGVTETTYTFADLAVGTHSAGVQRVYETGTSDIVTIDFEIVEPTYAVTFTVTDIDAGTAIEGASVEIDGETLTTAASGVATINLVDGDYDYTITMTDYETESGSITVAGAAVEEAVQLQAIGINDVATVNFNMYPNPTSGVVYIEAQGSSNVTVLNAIGEVVTTTEITNQGTIDLSNNASGVYFIRLTSGNKVGTQRIIVE